MHDRNSHVDLSPSQGRPVAWITWFLVGTTVAVFVVQLVVLYCTGDDLVGRELAFSADAWNDHRYWTLLTYAWVHAVPVGSDPWLRWLFWLHIVSNMLPIVCLGPALEEMFGRARYLGLYLGGAVAAALAWYVASSYFPGNNESGDDGIVGASGAVFAVIAAIGTAAPRVPVTVLVFFVVPLNMPMRMLALIIVGLEAVQALFNWMPEIAHSAHLGGAAFGFLYTLLLRLRSRDGGDPRQRRDEF